MTNKTNPVIPCLFYSTRNEERERSLVIFNKILRNYATEQCITSGLGFLDSEGDWRKEGEIKHYSDTEEGLQEHLRAMDNRVSYREGILIYGLLEEMFKTLCHIEDMAEERSLLYEYTLREVVREVVGEDRNLPSLERLIRNTRTATTIFPSRAKLFKNLK